MGPQRNKPAGRLLPARRARQVGEQTADRRRLREQLRPGIMGCRPEGPQQADPSAGDTGIWDVHRSRIQSGERERRRPHLLRRRLRVGRRLRGRLLPGWRRRHLHD